MSLNPQQQAAVQHDGPVLLVAPPGSGKTRVIVSRVGRQLGIDRTGQAIAVCFARDAANELSERIQAEHGASLARRVQVGTFHSLAKMQLERAGREVQLVDESERFHWIASVARRYLPHCDIDEALQALEGAKLDRAEGIEAPTGELGAMLKAYEDRLRRAGLMDFQDLLEQANAGMAHGTVRPLVATLLAIDETQDMNPSQLHWVEHHIRAGCELFAVGDDDQSIFSFCRALGLKGMRALVQASGATLLALTANYRSRSEIVAHAGSLIAHNTYREPKSMHALRGEGGGIAFHAYASADDQAADILSHVQSSIEGSWGILARNRHLLFDVQAQLSAAGVPCRILGQSVWRERPVRLFFVLLAMATGLQVRPASRDALLAWLDVADSEVEDLGASKLAPWSLPSAGLKPSRHTPSRALVELFERLPIWHRMLSSGENDALGLESVGEWLTETLTRLGGRTSSRKRDLSLIHVVRSALRRMQGSIANRIKAIRRLETSQQPMRVVLGTMHAAKGLEWDNVWLVSADATVIPNVDSPVDEERRLFYVAMTRARERLFVSSRRGAYSEFVYQAFPGCERAILAGTLAIGQPIHLSARAA